MSIRMDLDHYTTKFLTGHEDFNVKLRSFGRNGSTRCRCMREEKTVELVLFYCVLLEQKRRKLR